MIPVNTPLLAGNELAYLTECIETAWISSEGSFVGRFERAMADIAHRKHAIAVSSGSVGLDLAVHLLGLRPGDEVIMPTFTIISCAAAVIRAGATPVLVDSDPLTWNMDVNQLADKITVRTKAIMAVHLYGLPVDMDPILELAERHGLLVIEDAAEAHGQVYKDRPCGGLGTISVFSFYANKHVTTGEGGMILTDDDRLASRAKSFRDLCFLPAQRFRHEELGWNYRLSNLQAAIGLAQVEQLPGFIRRKRAIGKRYTTALSDLDRVQLPTPETTYAINHYWVYGLVLDVDFPGDAATMVRKLSASGVGARPFFWPMHEQPVFLTRGLFRAERYPNAERLARRGFYIPSGLGLSDDDLDFVSDTLRGLFS